MKEGDEGRWRLLVVDDEADIRMLMSSFLGSIEGARVMSCADEGEALVLLDGGFRPDFALVDFHLSGGRTSSRLCEEIKSRHPECALFLATGYVPKERGDTFPAVADAVLEKPFALSDLLGRVMQVLGDAAASSIGLTRFPSASRVQIEMLEELLAQRPDDVAGRHLLAFSFYTSQRYREAIEQYARVERAGHRTYLTKYYEGHAHARLRAYDEAIACWREALRLADAPLLAEKAKNRIVQAKELLRLEADMQNTRPGGSLA